MVQYPFQTQSFWICLFYSIPIDVVFRLDVNLMLLFWSKEFFTFLWSVKCHCHCRNLSTVECSMRWILRILCWKPWNFFWICFILKKYSYGHWASLKRNRMFVLYIFIEFIMSNKNIYFTSRICFHPFEWHLMSAGQHLHSNQLISYAMHLFGYISGHFSLSGLYI